MAQFEVVLDLRGLTLAQPSAQLYQSIWQQVETALQGRTLRAAAPVAFNTPRGALRLECINTPRDTMVGPGSTFAVVSILEMPAQGPSCASCPPGSPTQPRLPCVVCREQGRDTRLCLEHVSALAGSLRTFCADHTPACGACSEKAHFWCDGPCGAAWCVDHGVSSPSDPDRAYCKACYSEMFPNCGVAGCTRRGLLRCDFVMEAHRPCRAAVCLSHARQWKIYGPEIEGLCLCPGHQQLGHLTPEQLVYQLAAATVLRGGGGKRRHDGIKIPGLYGTRHTFIKQLGSVPSFEEVTGLYGQLTRRLSQSGGLEATLRTRLMEHQRALDREFKERVLPRQREAAGQLKRLQDVVRSRGFPLVADGLVATDYKPGEGGGLLFISLPAHLRREVESKGSLNLPAIGQQLGLKILWERGPHERHQRS